MGMTNVGATAPRKHDGGAQEASFEDLVGGRLLAWVGAIALLLGVVFFLGIAVSRGWLGELPRCALAAGGALGLLGFAVRMRERGGREEAVLTAAGTALGILFVDVAVAARTYELLPAIPATLLAAALGALGVVLAIRWDAKPVGVLGLLGGLVAPVLAGAPSDGMTIMLLLVTAAAGGGALVHLRWCWLALAAFAVTAPQVLAWLLSTPDPWAVVAALAAMGLITTAQAVGFELRTKAEGVRASGVYLLGADALLLAGGGSWALHAGGHGTIADGWLVGLAVAHGLVALLGARHPRVSDDLRLLSAGIAVALADIAWSAVMDGVAVSVGYAASAVGFAVAARVLKGRRLDGAAAQGALGAHLLLAAGQALVLAPHSSGGALALVLVPLAAACFASARVAALPRVAGDALDTIALGVLAYLAATSLAPLPLALAWAGESVALARVWRRTDGAVAGLGALAHLVAAATVALVFVATPWEALVTGFAAPAAALSTLAAVVAATGIGVRLTARRPALAQGLAVATAIGALLLAAGAVVTLAGGGQAGQMALSAAWATLSAGALVAGLLLRRGDLRRGAMVVLAATAAKVFVLDLAGLDSAYRAGSFIALGVLLLGAAFAWQRLRPALMSREPLSVS